MYPISWKIVLPVCAVVGALLALPGAPGFRTILASETPAPAVSPKPSVAKPVSGTDRIQRRSEMLERETAASIKEQELRKIGQSLESRMKQLDDAKKAYEAKVVEKKKIESDKQQEKYQKMIKVYKGLKPAAAAALLDKLDEKLAMELLNRMDQKTVVKLIPLLNQERVLKWTRLSLKNDTDQGL